MANRVSVDLDMNVQGYVQGIDKATKSTADYETEVRKVKESTVNFRKEFSAAKKEVQNLAAGYAMLSKEAKNSSFGREMARQLDEAKRKAAEYVDMQGDLQAELKNLASDTKALDQLSQAMGIAGDATAATMGIVAQFTGNEEDARRAVLAFTTAQSALGTVTKLQNALQKQSSIMLGVQRIQTLAAKAATDAQTSSVVGATVAQKAFNAVAKANPYVLLITGILAATAAVTAFMYATKKAETAQERLQKTMHAASLQGQKDAQADVVKLDLLYAATQNVNLSVKEREKAVKKLQDQYPGYFGDMTKEQIMLGEASAKYQQLRDDIIAVAKARAYEKKMTELAEQGVDLEDQIEKQEKLIKKREEAKKKNKGAVMPGMTSSGAAAGESWNIQAAKDDLADLRKQQEENAAAQQKLADKIQETIPQQQRLEEGTNKTKTTTSKATKEIQAEANSIADLEKKISTLQQQAKNGTLPEDLKDPAKYQAKLEEYTNQLKELKIKWGFEKPETQLQKLQAEVEAARQKFILAVDSDDKQAQQAALKAYYEAQDKLNEYQLSITIEPKVDESKLAEQRKAINEIIEDAFKSDEPKYKFDFLPEEFEKTADKALKQYDKLTEAKKKLSEIVEDPKASDAQIAAAEKGLDLIDKTLPALEQQLDDYQELSDAAEDVAEKNEKIINTANKIGTALNAAGQMFTALGDAAEDSSLKSVGIVAQAIANVALSYSQALNSASKNWVTWLAFGISGLATMVTMINQIKSATAGSYASGGIVPGTSYSGDRLSANVNSGEMILNKRQQQNLFNMLDSGLAPQQGGTNVQVTGVIRGTDLLLVQKNTNKVLSKAGSKINF